MAYQKHFKKRINRYVRALENERLAMENMMALHTNESKKIYAFTLAATFVGGAVIGYKESPHPHKKKKTIQNIINILQKTIPDKH